MKRITRKERGKWTQERTMNDARDNIKCRTNAKSMQWGRAAANEWSLNTAAAVLGGRKGSSTPRTIYTDERLTQTRHMAPQPPISCRKFTSRRPALISVHVSIHVLAPSSQTDWTLGSRKPTGRCCCSLISMTPLRIPCVTVVSRRQSSIYVMCPTDHDIWSLLVTTPPKQR